jgi:hypothetical protein
MRTVAGGLMVTTTGGLMIITTGGLMITTTGRIPPFSFILSFIAGTSIVLTYFYGSGKTQQELHMGDISGMLPIDWFQTV